MLSYLFVCRFKDGTIIQQTAEDVSQKDSTRSSFYDVMQRLEEVETFTLVKQDDRQHSFMVDLRDGHFEIDGVPFCVSSEELPNNVKFRLIYFHRHQHRVVQGQSLMGEAPVQYFIGWQTNLLNGENVQQTISTK